jgi:hypothetical protein
MAYKDMRTGFYVAATLGLFGVQMVGGILLEDISTLFNFISALGTTAISFWFPAGYYLMAVKKFGVNKEDNWVNTAYVYVGLGVLNFTVGMLAAIIGVIASIRAPN